VNEMRRTLGSLTGRRQLHFPNPCTTLNTPGGNPASSTRSISSEQLSGDHSAGLQDTVSPREAGAHFHVESMKGAFQGVITTVGPAGMRKTVWRCR